MKEKIPDVGDKIYIDNSFHISHGIDDVQGGIATISEIHISKTLPEDHMNSIFVSVKEIPGTKYNYISLMKEQEKLKQKFGDRKAYPDPDVDRPWIEDGDIVDGKVYHGKDIW